ncbi:carboxymuconolactone decarboxylase family protein [Corynebacterium sp. S7]
MTEIPAETQRVPNLGKFFPEVFKGQGRVVMQMRKVYPEVDLSDALVELVSTRVSQINGCAACLDTHAPAARKAGVSQTKLDVLPAWRELPNIFDEQEYMALELAEELTILPRGSRHTDVVRKACTVFAEEQVAALEWAIILINTYNRISIASEHQPRMPR